MPHSNKNTPWETLYTHIHNAHSDGMFELNKVVALHIGNIHVLGT